ncbi:hypothetical protein L2Y96_09365 [Luteibacter aegosomaticola]|uniref:hypothetical protein n=1 Tax=Luteibacter aegosomaticola TaxID=2911538 RepID=UPI001FF9210B|nr:hypothetical protein [Luteibacter aegosomaticola]UPG91955.1 hypothetical protein L2Y96_09365 [Luteibacter aegosomaticola]
MTLVELVVGLALAAIVAAGAVTGATAVTLHVRRDIAAAREAAGPGDVLDAMVGDVLADRSPGKGWSVCRVERGCAAHVGQGHGVALLAHGHAWVMGAGGLRVCGAAHCELVLPGASALQVWVDRHDGERIRRVEGFHPVAGAIRHVELQLWLADGTSRSRSAWVAP